ncbi:MAG: serine/threonine-protein kinase [Gemmatimonadota bacterium]
MDRLARALGNKYEVRRLLGQGGFAEVYEVWDRDLMRRLALKVLKPDIAWSSGMLERFKQEARAIARLNQPNILPIHFVGDAEGLVYYAMPFVEGQSLAALLRTSGALDPDRALAIAKPILEALSHAHQAGLVHRDVKPDNVMIEAGSGRVLLVDFGIAKQVDGSSSKMTQTGFVVGTPQYMSPEQALGQGDIDARTDIYAFGALLFQMVTGTPPFEGDTSQEIVGKHLSEPVPIPSVRNARIPRWLSDIIVRCLAKRAADRFQSAAMLLQALNEGRLSGSQTPVTAERVAKQIQEDATEVLPSSERKVPTSVPAPSGSNGGSGFLFVLLGLGLALVLGVAAYVLLGAQPVVVIRNELVEPIKVLVRGETIEVGPGGTLRRKLERGRPMVVQWSLVRPRSATGNPLGSELQGTFTSEKPSGDILKIVDARSAGAAYFAPLVTNAADRSVGIIVNAGLAGATDCYCPLAPGTTRAHIGYYPLYLNSAVQAYTTADTRATFRNLGAQVDRTNGTVGLKFQTRDLLP